MSTDSEANLVRLLQSELQERLTAEGWEADDVVAGTLGEAVFGVFRRRLTEEFSFAAEFYSESLRHIGIRPIVVGCEFGVSYDKSYRLWPLVVGYSRPWDAALAEEELFGKGEERRVIVHSPQDIPVAISQLVAVSRRALAIGGGYASIDGLLALARSLEEDDDRAEVMAVVLAAAGRTQEARVELDRYERLRATTNASSRRFILRLSRWLESNGSMASRPSRDRRKRPKKAREQASSPGLDRRMAPSNEQLRREQSERQEKRREAIDAVRRVKVGKSREQLADLYRAELHRRGLEFNPLLLEVAIDAICAETLSERREVARRAAHAVVSGLVQMAKDLPKGAWPSPQSMKAPPNASYPVRWIPGRWIDLEPDLAARPALDRLLSGAGRGKVDQKAVVVEAWLTWEASLSPDNAAIVVHIGSESVARIIPEDAVGYRDEMTRAAMEGELPALPARVTRNDDGTTYRLELAVPEGAT